MIIYLIIVGIVLCFGMVLMFGAPYLPTLNKQTETALDLLELKRGQTLLELGSGDGRVLNAAARRGINGVGIELNPILVLVSRLVTFRHRKHIRIIWGNFWRKDWPQADGIFVFLLDKYMPKLDAKIKAEYDKPVKLASFAFMVPGKKAVKRKRGVFLYRY